MGTWTSNNLKRGKQKRTVYDFFLSNGTRENEVDLLVLFFIIFIQFRNNYPSKASKCAATLRPSAERAYPPSNTETIRPFAYLSAIVLIS